VIKKGIWVFEAKIAQKCDVIGQFYLQICFQRQRSIKVMYCIDCFVQKNYRLKEK